MPSPIDSAVICFGAPFTSFTYLNVRQKTKSAMPADMERGSAILSSDLELDIDKGPKWNPSLRQESDQYEVQAIF